MRPEGVWSCSGKLKGLFTPSFLFCLSPISFISPFFFPLYFLLFLPSFILPRCFLSFLKSFLFSTVVFLVFPLHFLSSLSFHFLSYIFFIPVVSFFYPPLFPSSLSIFSTIFFCLSSSFDKFFSFCLPFLFFYLSLFIITLSFIFYFFPYSSLSPSLVPFHFSPVLHFCHSPFL